MELMIKQGFKQTEVGLIPEDWEIEKLGKVSDIKTGPFGSALHEKNYVRDGTPIITVEHLSDFGIVHQNLPMVSEKDRKRLKTYALTPGDIVFSRVGSVDRNSIVSENEDEWLFSGRLLRIKLKKSKVYPKYLNFHFQQENFKGRIRGVAVGQTMASLNTQILKNIKVAFPPTLSEQKAIATALSDVDALISSLELLITKKKDIKQGAMQQLLTGKTRVKGIEGNGKFKQTEVGFIPEDWEIKLLDEISDVIDPHPSHRAPAETKSGIPFLGIGDFNERGFIKSKKQRIVSKNVLIEHNLRYDLKENLIGLGRVASIGKVVTLRDDIGEYSISPTLGVIRSTDIDYNYLSFILVSNYIKNYFNKIMSGSTRSSVGMIVLRKIPIPTPTLNEQKAIAQILSDIDKELNVLKTKKAKSQAIKQGMMQELLTGKTRLVLN